jgi:2',3'-cyclic-nucleotide 2'-phosphodiesterase (5'-nucleotidase family)
VALSRLESFASPILSGKHGFGLCILPSIIGINRRKRKICREIIMANMRRRKGDFMKGKWQRWFLALVGLCLVILPVYGVEVPKTFHLTIFHSNDFHGYEPTNLARQATIINQTRSKEPNVLYLNAGDVFARGKYHHVFYGELEFAELNAMGLDAFTLGNNEFKATGNADTSQRFLFTRLNQANFPVLCANIRQAKDGSYLPNVKPYIIKTIAGVKIGIFGITANRTKTYRQAQGLIVDDQIETAQKIFPQIAAKSDIVIALTHIGFDGDQTLAGALPKLIAIVGGDSHTILSKPVNIGGIPIVQAGGENKQYLGRLDLTFEYRDHTWRLKEYQGILIPINASVPENPKIKAILDSYLAKIPKKAA